MKYQTTFYWQALLLLLPLFHVIEHCANVCRKLGSWWVSLVGGDVAQVYKDQHRKQHLKNLYSKQAKLKARHFHCHFDGFNCFGKL